MRALTVGVLIVITTAIAAVPASAGSCGGTSIWSACTSTSDGSQVDVTGTQTQPGSSNSGGGRPGDSAPAPEPEPEPAPPECLYICDRESYAVESLPDVTAADLVSFVPQRPDAAGEPAGLGIAGMPTNLFAHASEQVQTGTLLGYDVRVRFVPVAYRFDHGDGTARTTATGGASWAQLGVAAYTTTATSHAYGSPGAYRVSVSVVYDAAVDFGNGRWRPVRGSVTSATTGYDVRIVEVQTALVLRTCLEDPRGPGC